MGSLYNQACFTLYLALKMSTHILSLLDATIQASLAIRAKLKSFAFLKPSPP